MIIDWYSESYQWLLIGTLVATVSGTCLYRVNAKIASCQGFSLGTLVSSPPSSVHGSAHEIKLK